MSFCGPFMSSGTGSVFATFVNFRGCILVGVPNSTISYWQLE